MDTERPSPRYADLRAKPPTGPIKKCHRQFDVTAVQQHDRELDAAVGAAKCIADLIARPAGQTNQ